MGCTVQSGILAAFGAKAGFRTDVDMLDGALALKDSLPVDLDKLTAGLGTSCEFANISIKSYCAAKQVTGAIQGFLDILAGEAMDPTDIKKVTVRVPRAYAGMIDVRGIPRGRMESIMSAPYQLALAARFPDGLRDVARLVIHREKDFLALAEKVNVEADEGLERFYPAAWPAIVIVETPGGTLKRRVVNTKGDAPDPFHWDDIIIKAREVVRGIPTDDWSRLAEACRGLGRDKQVTDISGMMKEIQQAARN